VIAMTTENVQLNAKHIRIYKFIDTYNKQYEACPTYREIAKECEVALSQSHGLVKDLVNMGYLKMVGKRQRTIGIVK